jgi:site-specific DNA recombinase
LAEDDRGASGAAFELPQLGRMLELAGAGEFDVLVVREIDRLSRNLAKQLVVESELKQSGVRIEYVLGEYPDTPEGNFMKHVRASVAEFEREKIRERMLRGRCLKAKSGKWVGHCVPFGYNRIGSGREAVIAIDEVEAETVGQIFKWLVTEKTSLRQIAYWLTEAQIPIPGRDYNRPGTVWSSSTVRRILSNASYIGKFSYGGYTINLPEMAIVSEERFNLV